MADFSLNPDQHSTPPIPPALPESAGLSVQASISRSFLWMAIGLLITAAVSYGTYASGLLFVLMDSSVLGLLLIIAQFALVIGCSAAMKSASSVLLTGMFIAYSIVTGLSLSFIFEIYAGSLIFMAFAISAVYFICLAIVGRTTKMDLTKIGTIALVGLIVLILTQLVMMLFRTSMSERLYSIIGLVLFTGITAWDTQRLGTIMAATDGQPVEQKKWSIYFALELYLDFINIFLYVLRLLSAGSSSRK